MADSSAKLPVDSPGARVNVGIITFIGATRYVISDWRVVHQSRILAARFDKFTGRRRVCRGFVADGRQLAVRRRGEAQMLTISLPQTDRIEHILPREGQFYRTVSHS